MASPRLESPPQEPWTDLLLPLWLKHLNPKVVSVPWSTSAAPRVWLCLVWMQQPGRPDAPRRPCRNELPLDSPYHNLDISLNCLLSSPGAPNLFELESDHRDVVVSAGLIGQAYQFVAGLLRMQAGRDDLLDVGILHQAVQPIGT